MVSRILIVLAALLLPAQALANTLEGHWAFRIDDATIFVFRLDQLPGGSWSGAWKRPTAISSNGAVFQRMSGSEVVTAIATGERDGVVQLTFAGPPGNSNNDVLRFRLTGENQAELTYVGLPVAPYPLIRVRPDTALGPFEDNRIYDRDLAVSEAPYEAPWQPQGLVDQTGAAVALPAEEVPLEAAIDAALAALGEGDVEEEAAELPAITEEPVELADAAAVEGDDANAEDEEEEDRPRITADFLDGL
ncbi:hypothetical protein OZN62_11350 [Aurantiacibacter sp. MUD11]|uniref:hypothetical protein n=1 Tax=Aurantiacibacter sp. MUD11 TaxID=3003265 RepID=UPI0022AB165F|nr:hypothetical protein [Aurantiacibacter sp. MUD11]WAT17508.1 hypothetical protein OZN62_11350 [Aurantiacibacter sp. MUD11]